MVCKIGIIVYCFKLKFDSKYGFSPIQGFNLLKLLLRV